MARNLLIKIAQGIANRLWGRSYLDICYGMFLTKKEKYALLNIKAEGFDVE
jgi:hypothetical protein